MTNVAPQRYHTSFPCDATGDAEQVTFVTSEVNQILLILMFLLIFITRTSRKVSASFKAENTKNYILEK